jgi:hypothetical protein
MKLFYSPDHKLSGAYLDAYGVRAPIGP